jgi:hypothetical protein
MPSTVSISSVALAEIGADSIASMDEESIGARECSRVFDNVVADLLERSDWGFKIRRVTAAGLTNDRPADWNYAYAKPADASKVLRVLEPSEDDYPEWGIYSSPIWDAFGLLPFVEINGTVYTNVVEAVLEYAASEVSVSAFPPLFRRAVELELAARIAFPIKKDRRLKGDMIQQAEVAIARAVADDRNRNPTPRNNYISEAELARAGIEYGPVV